MSIIILRTIIDRSNHLTIIEVGIYQWNYSFTTLVCIFSLSCNWSTLQLTSMIAIIWSLRLTAQCCWLLYDDSTIIIIEIKIILSGGTEIGTLSQLVMPSQPSLSRIRFREQTVSLSQTLCLSLWEAEIVLTDRQTD
jgi:hypothetical protein